MPFSNNFVLFIVLDRNTVLPHSVFHKPTSHIVHKYTRYEYNYLRGYSRVMVASLRSLEHRKCNVGKHDVLPVYNNNYGLLIIPSVVYKTFKHFELCGSGRNQINIKTTITNVKLWLCLSSRLVETLARQFHHLTDNRTLEAYCVQITFKKLSITYICYNHIVTEIVVSIVTVWSIRSYNS